MKGPPAPRRAENAERDAVGDILTDAFVDEPGLNWWLKQDKEKERARARFFHAVVRTVVHPRRELWICGDEAAALWCPPGAAAFQMSPIKGLLLTPFWLTIAGQQGMRRAMAFGAALAEQHPAAPHAHLVFLGVRQRAQGRGLGSALLKAGLAGVDSARLPAYLEATLERNVALYLRHGFEITAEFDAPGGGPHVWAMVRAPAAAPPD
ncbi:MAG: GNAT family N-acetyltransferase [Alphaproteobacteria bacterium]|nr:GNAT family N-acetyltransferase [Alphaproteobacteria bacterium]